MQTAFVTGATGLLGNNLVRLLLQEGYRVKALARSQAKAEQQLAGLDNLEVVIGDMEDVAGFSPALEGCDIVFHTAAYFRDSYKGGKHWEKLKRVNVDGTRDLLAAAHESGIRRIVHTSSIAVLNGEDGDLIDETMTRKPDEGDDYYRSKILADEEVFKHLEAHPDSHVCMVLPGWMHGPGDLGPTSAGQFTLDYMNGSLPGLPAATFSYVDARDVAMAQLAAARQGRRGERYLAAGRGMTMVELSQRYQEVTGKPAPKTLVPYFALYTIAFFNEVRARVFGQQVLLSMDAVNNMRKESFRTRFNHTKSETELGLTFRPVEHTIRDEVNWFRSAGLLEGGVIA